MEEQAVAFVDEVDRSIALRVVAGSTNKVIARDLSIPEGTVKWRLHGMYQRLGVASRVEFAMRARDLLEKQDPEPRSP